MLRDEFAVDAAAVKHRFCNSFRGLSPLNLFEFGGVAFVLTRIGIELLQPKLETHL